MPKHNKTPHAHRWAHALPAVLPEAQLAELLKVARLEERQRRLVAWLEADPVQRPPMP